MHDLPSQTLLQQAHARPITGEDLEVLGKQAAASYAAGAVPTLTEAVVETVKHAGLSPEQVRRVVEFTNQSAYLAEFKKEGSAHKYIEFHGGPADPSEVLKDLNDGGGGTVFDRGIADYSSPPPKTASVLARNRAALGLEKTASADPAELALHQAFMGEDAPLPFDNPTQDSEVMREKLSAARDNLTAELNVLETEYLSLSDHLFALVKQAALTGTPLGHVIQAWQDVTPGPGYVKAAFALIGPRLVEEEVFRTAEAVASSLVKTAESFLLPNRQHPLVATFAAYCEQLDKLATARAARDEVDDYFNRIDWFIKRAGGLVGAAKKVWSGAGQLGEAIAPTAERLIGHSAAGTVARVAPKAALVGGAYMAGDTAYDHLKYGPVGKAGRAVVSHIPGTDADRYREALIASRYQ